MQSLAGKAAVITGASSGIGKAAARLLLAEGVEVVLAARRKERMDALVEELGDKAMRERRESLDALTSEDVAPALVYAFARSPRVLVEEILVRPVKQVAP